MHTSMSEPMAIWRSVLAEVSAEIDTVAGELLDLVTTLPSYRRCVDPTELRAMARESLIGLIRAAAGEPGALSEQSEQLGRRRARQQVPADEMTRALRMDFEVLWAAVRRHLGAEDHAPVLACLDLLWRAVEEHARSAERGYLLESNRLARASGASLDTMVALLFGPEEGRATAAAALRRELGLPDGTGFEVVVAVGEPAWLLAERVAGTENLPGNLLVHRELDSTTAFWRSGNRPPEAITRALDDLPSGFASVERLDDVPSGARTAQLIARALPSDHRGPARIDDAWPLLARAALAESGLVHQTLRDLLERPDEERERLVTTARVVLERGSVVAAAQLLHCHRNTVIGRLNRLRDLTCLDISQPRDAALMLILLSSDL